MPNISTMLAKLFRSSRRAPPPGGDPEFLPLRIIHAGGYVEQYYMAIPASEILKKYPRAILARPQVFHRPWDSLVFPDELLAVGEKFYVMAPRTIQKLRRKIMRPSCESSEGDVNSESVSFEIDEGLKKLEISDVEPQGKTKMQAEDVVVAKRKFGKRKVRVAAMWQPSLTSIDEASPLPVPQLHLQH